MATNLQDMTPEQKAIQGHGTDRSGAELPTRFIAIAFFLTIAAMVGLGYQVWRSYENLSSIQRSIVES